MEYKSTVNFSRLTVGEIVEIPEDNDLPESYFTTGFLIPHGEPEKKAAPKVESKEPYHTPTTQTTGSTTSTKGTKSDKLD